jgi:hypothetical protein
LTFVPRIQIGGGRRDSSQEDVRAVVDCGDGRLGCAESIIGETREAIKFINEWLNVVQLR